MENIISLAIVEDDKGIREGIAAFLISAPDIHLTGVYASGEEALEGISRKEVDVILMDISMPGISGIECTRRIKKLFPSTQIIMLTVYEDDKRIFESLKAGASGYLLKRTQLEQILEAIHDVYKGGAPMTPSIARRVLEYFNDSGPEKVEYNLTPRENEILAELTDGFSYKTIAEHLFVSVETIRTHVKNIYEKLHVHSKSEAISKVLKERKR